MVSQAEIVAILNLAVGEKFPPWWTNINLGVVSVEDQPPLDQLFPDNFDPNRYVTELLRPPDDLSGFESAAEAMGTSPLVLSCEFANRGQVEAATGYFQLELVQMRQVCEALASAVSSTENDSPSFELLDAAEERRRALEEGYAPLVKGAACRQAEAFSRSLAGTARNGDLASRLWEETEAFANHASEFEDLLNLRG